MYVLRKVLIVSIPKRICTEKDNPNIAKPQHFKSTMFQNPNVGFPTSEHQSRKIPIATFYGPSENMKVDGQLPTIQTWFGRSEWKGESKSQFPNSSDFSTEFIWFLCRIITVRCGIVSYKSNKPKKHRRVIHSSTHSATMHMNALRISILLHRKNVRVQKFNWNGTKNRVVDGGPHVIWANGETKVKSISQIRATLPGGQPQCRFCSILKNINRIRETECFQNKWNRFAYLWKKIKLWKGSIAQK